MNVTLDFALKTHPGLVRPLNEDAIGADPSCGLFALADGLGGYNAGEVASVMAISSVLERLSSALADSRANEVNFTPDEAMAIRSSANARPISLGPRILRAETAALAAIAAWMSTSGDWR